MSPSIGILQHVDLTVLWLQEIKDMAILKQSLTSAPVGLALCRICSMAMVSKPE